MDFRWLLSCAAITAAAVFLRFYDLSLKPLHHDEGVNGWFLTTLFNDGVYQYDPANYHGPTLYYIALFFADTFGLETIPIRASVAVFGVLTVVLIFYLRRHIGDIGTLTSAAFVALSPGMVYISRYFIHEMLFVFLSLAIVISVLFFIDRKKAGVFAGIWMALLLFVCFLPSAFNLAQAAAGSDTSLWVYRSGFAVITAALIGLVMRMLYAWEDGRPIYLLLASAAAAFMFATKETAFITLGTMLIACVCVAVWHKIEGGRPEDTDGLTFANFREGAGTGVDRVLLIMAVLAAFIFVFVLFFSSFFTFPEGVKKAFEAYAIWTKTGNKDHTQSGYFGYLYWGMRVEAPIFILALVGGAAAFISRGSRFARFVALWAFGLFAAYSIIPYKTPWLALSFILPMAITAGFGVGTVLNTLGSGLQKTAGAVVLFLALGTLGYQTVELNFVRYDDNDMPYVYAHTKREFLDLVAEIEHFSEASGKAKDAGIQIVSPDYWPMVWYLRKYPNAAFTGHLADAGGAEMIVSKDGEQDTAAELRYGQNYTRSGTYALRPGVDLSLWVRNDLAGK